MIEKKWGIFNSLFWYCFYWNSRPKTYECAQKVKLKIQTWKLQGKTLAQGGRNCTYKR